MRKFPLWCYTNTLKNSSIVYMLHMLLVWDGGYSYNHAPIKVKLDICINVLFSTKYGE